jgi:hypothetical protein
MINRIACAFLLICLLGTSCGSNDKQQNSPVVDANQSYYESIRHMTGLEFQPRIQKGDSVEVIFYTDPDGDPKRYTRFYTLYSSTDTAMVVALKQSVNKHFERIERVKDCRSEGKVHFFANGNPTQTVYFSNRGDSCNHLYFIADGWFFYMSMDSSTSGRLSELKKKSIAPPGRVQD